MLGGTSAFTYAGSDQKERTGAGLESFLYSAQGIARRTTATATTSYTREPDGTLIGQRTGSTREYPLIDGLDSTVGLVDQTGATVASYTYSPYGETVSATGSSDTIWRYAGEQLDPTGLYKIGARYYEPGLGGWTQQDPLRQTKDPRQANRYVYAGADPINNVDPTGCWFHKKAWKGAKCVAKCGRHCSSGKLFACLPRCYSWVSCSACLVSSCGVPAAKCMYYCLK